VESQTEFDHQWLREGRRLTSNLVQAEHAYLIAKKAAVAAGVDLRHFADERSGFVDDASDGYRLSWEEDVIAAVSREFIKGWMNDIPSCNVQLKHAASMVDVCDIDREENTNSGKVEVEIDEWEASSVQLCDSASMVAEGFDRRHIDEWRQTCGRA